MGKTKITDEYARQFGYKDANEMLLYMDVCCKYDGIGPKSLEDLLLDLENDIGPNKSKESYEEYIKSNNLLDLFNSVKNLSELERLMQIYTYYYNLKSMNDYLAQYLKIKENEAESLFDGEKTLEYGKKVVQTLRNRSYNSDNTKYIVEQALDRLNQQEAEIFLKFKNSFGKNNNPDDETKRKFNL